MAMRAYRPGEADTRPPRALAAAHVAASHDDQGLAGWSPPAGSPDADLLSELDTIRPRARDLARNNGLASGAIRTHQDNIIGHTLRLSAQPHYRLLGQSVEWARDWARTVEAQFGLWADTTECDAGRSLNLRGLATQAMGGALLNGEGLTLAIWHPRPGSAWGTRLLNIEADRLDTPPHLSARADVRDGIEIDRYGAPVAYWIRNTHPGDAYGWGLHGQALAGPEAYTRIPAFTPWGRPTVIHLHDKERSGQSRGKPLVTAVMREFRLAGHMITSELQAVVANSLVAGFLESDLDPDTVGQLFSSPDESGEVNAESYWQRTVGAYGNNLRLRGGAMIPLPAGAKLNSFTPNRPNSAFDPFMENVLRHVAAGMNLPYELLAKDFSKTNYSSARAALMEAWRYFLARRRWIADHWLSIVYALWMEEAVDRGFVDAPDFYSQRHAYLRARWVMAGRGWVDPVKEATAAQMRMETGLSTLEHECAEQGLDWEEVLQQRAREREMMDSLGLLSASQAAASRPVQPEPQPADQEESST